MIDGTTHRILGVVSTVLVGTVLAGPISPIAAARQIQAPLQITVPTTGITVSPGQTLSVTVASPAGLTFTQVDVIGEFPIGLTTSATAPTLPAQFSVSIPSSIACGPRMLTAEGTTTSGQNVQSASIVIDVERSDFPVALRASVSALTLESQGQQLSFVLYATYSDGKVLRATESSYVSYASSNSAVATVNATGLVTAVASGDAAITATYTLGSLTNQISIPVSVQLPMLTSSPSSLNFPDQGVGTTSSSQQVTLSNASGGTVSVLSVVANSDFSEADNCIALSPLGANGSCAVNVTFSPTATGTRTGNLKIANSANVAPMSIALTGTGTAAPPPTITSLSPTSGPVGTSVTITGTNFGSSQGTSTIKFNGTTATPTSWSATSIVVPVPAGATTGNVVVTVGGVASNGISFTVISRPVAYVQGNSATQWTPQSAVTVMQLPYTAAQTAGNLNVVVVSQAPSIYYGPNATISSVTDTRGNVYLLAAGPTVRASVGMQAIYYAKNISAAGPNANTVTVTFATPVYYPEIRLVEYSGLDTANPLDVSVANQGYACLDPSCPGGRVSTSGPVTTTNANDLLVGANLVDYVVGEFTTQAGAGFTARIMPSGGDILEDMVVSATGSYSATAPLYQDGEYIMQVVAFRKATP